jgi:hypothetical protein
MAKKQESMTELSNTIFYFNNLSQSLTAIIVHLKSAPGNRKIVKLFNAVRERVDKKLLKLRKELHSRDRES